MNPNELDALHEGLRRAVHEASRAFHAAKKGGKLDDLSPRFWVALLDLEVSAGDPRVGAGSLAQAVFAASRRLGAPGDFGYDTLAGNALRNLYKAHDLLTRALKQAAAEPQGAQPC